VYRKSKVTEKQNDVKVKSSEVNLNGNVVHSDRSTFISYRTLSYFALFRSILLCQIPPTYFISSLKSSIFLILSYL
jgi:hypothetical protein